jgi:hypothetical protein
MQEVKTMSLYKGQVQIEFKEASHSYWLLGEKKKRLTGVTTIIGKAYDKSTYLIPWAINETIASLLENRSRLIEATTETEIKELLAEAKKASSEKRDLAAEIGSAIHGWVESFIKGEAPEMPEDDRVSEGVNNFIKWLDGSGFKLIDTEKIVYSKKYGFVGTLDITGERDGKRYLIDIKTGNAIYPEYRIQTAAYLKAEQEESGQEYAGRVILRISKETEEEYYTRMKKKTADDSKIPPFVLFEACEVDAEVNTIEEDYQAFICCLGVYQWRKENDK